MFEPTIILYGSSEIIANTNLAFPVKTQFVYNEASLEQLIKTDLPCDVSCRPRYFLVLLESIDYHLLKFMYYNHRIEVIYSRKPQWINDKVIRLINNHTSQFMLDLTDDICRFLKNESDKQVKLENIPLGEIYCRKARVLKEWAMSSVKVIIESSHILIYNRCFLGRSYSYSTYSLEYY